MAHYSAIKAAVNAYIKQNGRKEITGRILNAVLNATIDSLGRYFQFAGGALPTDDPGTPDQNVCYLAGEPGVYTNFGGITIENEEVALLFWDGEWTKQRILIGIREVNASVDNQVGTPSVDVSYSGGELVLTFHNLKGEQGETGDPAGFGTIGADINGGVGTPGVSVETSGDNTAKNLMFHFTNLKGETGVTSVVATIDNTSGTPSCQVSLVGQQLTLAFSGLKGLKGDTGVSADYPITIYNGLDSDATDQALAAYQGKVLDGKIGQLEAKVDDLSTGKYYGYFAKEEDLPEADVDGFAYVGSGPTYTIYNCVGGVWTSSDITVNQSPIGNDEDINQNEDGKLQFANRVYNAQQPNGMGYKILRKEATFASQVTNTNTIYEIRYPFALGENAVTIPADSELRFNGGSITSGSLVLQNTLLSGDVKIGLSVTVTGTVANNEVTPKMFGATGNGVTEDTTAFRSAVDVCDNIIVPKGTYVINCGNQGNYRNIGIVIRRSNVHIKLEDAILKAAALPSTNPQNDFRNLITVEGSGVVGGVDTRIENFTLEGGTLIGSRDQFVLPSTGLTTETRLENYCGVAIRFCNNVTIKNCTITDNPGDAIYTAAVDNLHIENVIAKRNRRDCFSIGLDNGVVIKNCKIDTPRYVEYSNGNYSYGISPRAGISFEPEPSTLRAISNEPIRNITIDGCEFDSLDSADEGRYAMEGPCVDLVIRNCIFRNSNKINLSFKDTSSVDGPNYKGENITFENNIIEAITITTGTNMNYFMATTFSGNIVLARNTINGIMLADVSGFNNLLVQDNRILNFDTLLANIIGLAGVDNVRVRIRSNSGDALCICPRIRNAKEVIIENNVLNGSATNLNGRSEFAHTETTVSRMVLDSNIITVPTRFFIEKSITDTNELIIKNNVVDITNNAALWFDMNGSRRYVKADIIGNLFKTVSNQTLVPGEFEYKMNVINNVFAGLETKFTQDENDTTHLTFKGNVYEEKVVPTSGASEDRPLGGAIIVGFCFYDTTLNKPIWAKSKSGNTVVWVDATGATV